MSYKLDDFLDYTYDGMLEAELSRPLKREPIVEFHIPKRIFVKEDQEECALPLVMKVYGVGKLD